MLCVIFHYALAFYFIMSLSNKRGGSEPWGPDEKLSGRGSLFLGLSQSTADPHLRCKCDCSAAVPRPNFVLARHQLSNWDRQWGVPQHAPTVFPSSFAYHYDYLRTMWSACMCPRTTQEFFFKKWGRWFVERSRQYACDSMHQTTNSAPEWRSPAPVW